MFRLENGFDPQTGMANQNGRLFGRYAYVGLSNDRWGTLTAGRQAPSPSTSSASSTR